MRKRQITVQDFIDLIDIKSNLIYGEENDLKDLYDDGDIYIKTIHIIDNLLFEDDGVFAILDKDITRNLITLLNLRRFEIKDTHPEEYALINNLIIKINEVRAMPVEEQEVLRKKCINKQGRSRDLIFYDYCTFLDAMGVDAFFLDYLQGEEIPEEIPNELIIGSMVYLNNYIPGIFELEEEKEKIEELMNRIENTSNEILIKRKTELLKQKVLKR